MEMTKRWTGLLLLALLAALSLSPALAAQGGTDFPSAVTGLVYTGEPQTAVPENSRYVLENHIQTNAGSYLALVRLTDPVNDFWSDTGDAAEREIPFTIARKPVEVPVARLDLVYTGAEQVGIILPAEAVLKNEKATNAGDYFAIASLPSDNHYWEGNPPEERNDIMILFTIERKPIPVPQGKTDLVFNGELQAGVAAGEGYTLSDHEEVHSGAYEAKAVLGSNYRWAGDTLDIADRLIPFYIDLKPVEVPEARLDLVYTGAEQVGIILPTETGLKNEKATDAGDYMAVASLLSDDHYWEGNPQDERNDIMIPFTIERKPVPVPQGKTDLVFNGEPQAGVAAGEGYTLEGHEEVHSGAYEAKAVLGNNYRWADEALGTYDLLIPFYIDLKPVEVPEAHRNLVYNGEEQVGIILPTETFLRNEKATDAGDYEAIASLISEDHYWEGNPRDERNDFIIPFTIARVDITPPQAVTGLVADGSVQTGVPYGHGFVVENNTAVAAGTYEARARLADEKNTQWADTGDSAPRTIAWVLGSDENSPHPALNVLLPYADALFSLDKGDGSKITLPHRITGRMSFKEGMALRVSLALQALESGDTLTLLLPGRAARQLIAEDITFLETRAFNHRIRLNLKEIVALPQFTWDGGLAARLMQDEGGQPHLAFLWQAADGTLTDLAADALPGSFIQEIQPD